MSTTTEENNKTIHYHAVDRALRTKALEVALNVINRYNEDSIDSVFDLSDKIYKHISGLDKVTEDVLYETN